MRNIWHLGWTLFGALVALVSGGQGTASADVRSFVAIRQELRAELLACMSDGQLDQRERSLLEQKAAEKLSPDALEAFRETLDRMSGTATAASGLRMPEVAAAPVQMVRPTAHYSMLDPAVPTIRSDEGPEIPILNLGVVSEEEAARIEQALGDGSWDADATLYGRPGIEPANSPLVYTSRVAREMADHIALASQSQSLGTGCSEAGCDEGGCYQEPCFEGSPFESYGVPVCGPFGLDWIQVSATADAFQGPLDLDGRNGNFGTRLAVNAALPLSRALGIGVQAGTSVGVADFYGTQFTGSRVRSQNFTTVGIFQRLCLGSGALKYGFAFDWQFDDYYTSFTLSQWRVKLGWEVSSVAEIGLWSTIPNDGDVALLGAGTDFATLERFKPFTQGSLYWTRCWLNGTTTTAYVGIAEEPGEWIFGGDARIPMGGNLAFIGNLHYVVPSASGMAGQDEEVWNLGLGLEWTPSPCANRCRVGKFTPLFRLADNGLLGVRRY